MDFVPFSGTKNRHAYNLSFNNDRNKDHFLSQEEYNGSKLYPMFPRYTILKDMIKDIMHNPDYMEVCHEVDQA